MQEPNAHIDELIARVLSNEASPSEISELESWKNRSAVNQDYFDRGKMIFDIAGTPEQVVQVNTTAAWARLQTRINEDEVRVIPLFNRPAFRIAASLILIAMLVVLFIINGRNSPEPFLLAATEKPVERKLPDGSMVMLKRHSKLTYLKTNRSEREIKLEGEAFFNVVHNEKEPFVIRVDEVTITDVGTSFNVKAPARGNVEVFVESGIVELSWEGKVVRLEAGERGTYDRLSHSLSKGTDAQSANEKSFRSRELNFSDASLQDVIDRINEVYGTDIRLADPASGTCRLSVTFRDEDPGMMIEVITETLDMKSETRGTTTILTGRPCKD